MFDVFIALFGGLYYAGKYSKEKSEMKLADENLDNKKMIWSSLRNKYTDYNTEVWARKYLLSGDNYEEICNNFAEYFRYVLGDDWKNNLDIPNGYSVDYRVAMYPKQHIFWVYHMLLAEKSKIATDNIGLGFLIGGIQIKDMNIMFAKCIEDILRCKGNNVSLVFELRPDPWGQSRDANDVCGGYIKLAEFCNYPYIRLW